MDLQDEFEYSSVKAKTEGASVQDLDKAYYISDNITGR